VVSNTLHRKQLKDDGANKLYDSNGWLLLDIVGVGASTFYGSGTKWCVSTKKGYNILPNYLKYGAYYFIIDRQGEKYSVFIAWNGNELWMDSVCSDVLYGEVVNNIKNNIPNEVMDSMYGAFKSKSVGKTIPNFTLLRALKKLTTFRCDKNIKYSGFNFNLDELECIIEGYIDNRSPVILLPMLIICISTRIVICKLKKLKC
jgi:hypothetical protein